MIVLVGGEKGGTGKTSLAIALTVLRAEEGRGVVLVDTDPQETASIWNDLRENSGRRGLNVVRLSGDRIDLELESLSKQFEDVVIDAGGRDSVEMRSSMAGAHRMLVPVRASQFDIWTLVNLRDLCREARDGVNPNLRVLVAINNAPTYLNAKEIQEARRAILDLEELEVIASVIRERVAHRHASRMGLTATELTRADGRVRDYKAANELRSLYREVYET